MPPRAPFCHPSCFAQQQLHSAPAGPGHGLPDLTLGGSTRWFSWRLEAGSLWCQGDADAARLARCRRWGIVCSLYQKPSQQVCNSANSRRVQEPAEGRKVDWGDWGESWQITTADTGELFTLYKTLPHLPSNRVPMATLGGRKAR